MTRAQQRPNCPQKDSFGRNVIAILGVILIFACAFAVFGIKYGQNNRAQPCRNTNGSSYIVTCNADFSKYGTYSVAVDEIQLKCPKTDINSDMMPASQLLDATHNSAVLATNDTLFVENANSDFMKQIDKALKKLEMVCVTK